VILTRLNLTKLKLEFLTYEFQKKAKDKPQTKIFVSLKFDFFRLSSNLLYNTAINVGLKQAFCLNTKRYAFSVFKNLESGLNSHSRHALLRP